MNTQQQQPHHSESLINTCGFVYSLHGEGVRWVHAMLVRHCGKYSFSWGFAKLRDTRIYNIIFVYLGAHIRHTFQIVWLAGNEKKKWRSFGFEHSVHMPFVVHATNCGTISFCSESTDRTMRFLATQKFHCIALRFTKYTDISMMLLFFEIER